MLKILVLVFPTKPKIKYSALKPNILLLELKTSPVLVLDLFFVKNLLKNKMELCISKLNLIKGQLFLSIFPNHNKTIPKKKPCYRGDCDSKARSIKRKRRTLFVERKTRLELATPTLARLCSTN
mgnify:CR=1 FL=1